MLKKKKKYMVLPQNRMVKKEEVRIEILSDIFAFFTVHCWLYSPIFHVDVEYSFTNSLVKSEN